jgi:hypothetical protein
MDTWMCWKIKILGILVYCSSSSFFSFFNMLEFLRMCNLEFVVECWLYEVNCNL